MMIKSVMKYLPYIFVITIFSGLGCGSGKAVIYDEGTVIDFVPPQTLSSVLDKAESEDKIVFVDMYADWCLPCKVMDAEVFADVATADFMNANFINYKVDGEKGEGPDLVVLFGVEGYPTQLFLDSRGNIIEKNLGSLGIVGFNVLAERALAKAKKSK